MVSGVETNGIKTGRKTNFPFGRRFLLIFFVICIQMIYIPTSNRVMGGIEPRLPIDLFPIWPVWVLPYVLCYPLWLFCVLWAILKMDDRMFRSFLLACIFTFAISVSIFIAFPTYVRPATLSGSDGFTALLRFIHEEWGRYNAFPSGHIYITALFAIYFGRWYPRSKPLWVAILVIVSLSTLFTAQHYIADIAGGLLVAWTGFHLGSKWTQVSSGNPQPAKNRLLLPPSS